MIKKILTTFVMVFTALNAWGEALSVYQVNAVMTYAGKLKTDTAFVVLENDTSRFEEHGKGGYSLVLAVSNNAGGSYTADTEIYADMGKGQQLIGSPSVTLEKKQPATVSFESELVGHVELQLTLVEHVQTDGSELQECKYVECD
jgi:hypothetical protein